MLRSTILKRLLLSRFFLNLAIEHVRSHREVATFAAINLIQDSTEYFLLAASEHLNVRIGKTTEFPQYLDKIDERIAPNTLPFRPRLVQMNKVRVSAKHDGIKPD